MRVVGQARVGDVGDAGVLGQEGGDRLGVLAVPLQSQRQGDRAAHDQPGVEGCDGAAGVVEGAELDLVDEVLGADDGAAHGVAVPVDVLGQGVDDQVGAVVERGAAAAAA